MSQGKGTHTVYNTLTVHLVFSTKYRYHVWEGEVQIRCRDIMRQVCDALDIEVVKGVVSRPVLLVVLLACNGEHQAIETLQGEWPIANGTKANTKYSSLTQINRENVTRLQFFPKMPLRSVRRPRIESNSGQPRSFWGIEERSPASW